MAIILDYILTSTIFIVFGISLLANVKRESEPSYFSKDYCSICKALACLVVVYVHIPCEFQNVLQDAISSFAYVGVTCFFMISAYGMQYSLKKNERYLTTFWRNRLVSLLVPSFLVNALAVCLAVIVLQNDFRGLMLVHVSSYVKVLLVYCLFFFSVQYVKKRFKLKFRDDYVLIFGVFISSLWDYFTHIGVANSAIANWPYERMGLIWGVVLYQYRAAIKSFFEKKRIVKTIVLCVVSLVLGIAYLKFKHQLFWGEYLLKICLGFAILLFALIATYGYSFKSRICLFVGEISFEVYLAHEIVIHVFANLFKDAPSGIFVFSVVLSTIFIASLLHLVAEPLVKLGRSSS